MDPVWNVGSEEKSEDEGVQISEWTEGHRVFEIFLEILVPNEKMSVRRGYLL